jgi:hypothetical protein
MVKDDQKLTLLADKCNSIEGGQLLKGGAMASIKILKRFKLYNAMHCGLVCCHHSAVMWYRHTIVQGGP